MSEPGLVGRNDLIAAITAFLADQYAPTLGGIRDAMERELDLAGPDALARLGERLAETGSDWSFCPLDSQARRIHHTTPPESTARGAASPRCTQTDRRWRIAISGAHDER